MYQKERKRNNMNTKIFTTLPQEAKDIRIEVFMKEQGFENEFMKSTLLVIISLSLMKENPSEHADSSKKTIITLLEG